MQTLVLHDTCRKIDPEYLDKYKTALFFDALSQTGLVKSLDKVKVKADMYDINEMFSILCEYKFEVKVSEK